MSLAVCLLAYSMVLAVFAPPLLSSITARGSAPRLAVTVWLAVMASVLAAWAGAVVLSSVQIVGSWNDLGKVLIGCVAGLRLIAIGGYGPVLQIALLVLAGLSVTAGVVLAVRVGAGVRRAALDTRSHAQAARLAANGMPPGPRGSLVIDSAQPAVYCLAGRPATVVVTRAALDSLTDDQLAAVLAHEQAHLDERHHPILATTRALARILPRLRLFSEGATAIAHLLELCADDSAARDHGRRAVADALIALALPPPGPATPAVALGATALGVAGRVERLLLPAATSRDRITLTLILVAVTIGPALTAGMNTFAPTFCAT